MHDICRHLDTPVLIAHPRPCCMCLLSEATGHLGIKLCVCALRLTLIAKTGLWMHVALDSIAVYTKGSFGHMFLHKKDILVVIYAKISESTESRVPGDRLRPACKTHVSLTKNHFRHGRSICFDRCVIRNVCLSVFFYLCVCVCVFAVWFVLCVYVCA
jgi:hypothetical protein